MQRTAPSQLRRRIGTALLFSLVALGVVVLAMEPFTDADVSTLPQRGASLGAALGYWFWASVHALSIVTSVLCLTLTLGAGFAALALYGPQVFQTLLRRLNELGSALPALLLLMLWRLGEPDPTPVEFVTLLAVLNSIETARLLAEASLRVDVRTTLESLPPPGPRRWGGFLREAFGKMRPRLAAQAALVAASVFGLDAALAFVGMGLDGIPTWGGVVGTAARTHEVSWSATVLCTVSIVATVLAVHQVLRRKPGV